MKKIKVYIAGKVTVNPIPGVKDWREYLCKEISRLTKLEVINLDPTKSHNDFLVDHSDPQLIFGRDCFMIQNADIVIIYLSDDTSVGASQEMVIAKYFKKPLVSIAASEGKFVKSKKILQNKEFLNWTHPFVAMTSDAVVPNVNEAALFVKSFFSKPTKKVKDISVIDKCISYYKKNFHRLDTYLHFDSPNTRL